MHIETPRLVIRSFEPSDLSDYAPIVADPEVMKHIGDGSTHTRDGAAQYIEDSIRRERETGLARYAVVRKREGDFIGFCGFRELETGVDFGWRYSRHVWGQGHGGEAALAVLDYGLNVLGLTNLFAHAFVENVASIRIIEKLGFARVEHDEMFGRKVIRYWRR
jgi:RimJ/RimL family protein N-acetyltransferase